MLNAREFPWELKQLEKDPFADFLESNSRGSIVKAKVLEVEEREATLELAADVGGVEEFRYQRRQSR